MDKIKALLEQLGGSKELVVQIVESLDQFKSQTEKTIKEAYQQRLVQAKEACMEEVNTYKRGLARKTQIFFEAKVEKIEQQIAKQVAIKDSAAETKLQAIVGMLEGVEVNSEGKNGDIQAAQKQLKELQEELRKTKAANTAIAEKAERAHSVAERTLERNRVLSTELVEASQKPPCPKCKCKPCECKPCKTCKKSPCTCKGTKSEGKKKGKKAISEGRKRKGKTVTARKASQGQIARTKSKPANAAPETRSMDGFSPGGIAEGMDE